MKMKITCTLLLAVLIAMSTLTGCLSPKGKTVEEKRITAQNMASEALNTLYTLAPEAQQEIAAAPGYGVFRSIQTQMLIGSTANAYGIVRDNQTGSETHMRAFGGGAGFGAGIKDFRAVVIFKNRKVMEDFVKLGWVFGATGTADAMRKREGVSVSGAVPFDSRLKIYTFTQTGLKAGVALRGTKVWKNKELN